MSDEPPCRKLIVTGATGKQGGALIRALLAVPSQPFDIYAVTRDPRSPASRAPSTQPHVHLIRGDFSFPAFIFSQVTQPWGLFLMTDPADPQKEARQGIALVTAALDAGVQHIVFTATDRGRNADTDPTPVPHFASKYAVEQHLISATSTREGVSYTILRPTAFFENITRDFRGRAFVTMWRSRGGSRTLQMVSTADIGRVAAEAFLHHADPGFRNARIGLAGDEISPDQATRVFREVTGRPLPRTYALVGRMLLWVNGEHLGRMFAWFASDGYAVDIPATRARFPFMMDFRTWVERESAWRQPEEQQAQQK